MKTWRDICRISRNNIKAISEWFNRFIAECLGIAERRILSGSGISKIEAHRTQIARRWRKLVRSGYKFDWQTKEWVKK